MYLMIVAKTLCNEMMNMNIKVYSYEAELVDELLEVASACVSSCVVNQTKIRHKLK